MMSRTGSFPLEVAIAFLKRYCASSSVVLDPFCGKGTTLLAARILGHRAYGLDIAPESIACTAAKLASVSLIAFERYISTIRLGRPNLDTVPPSVRTFFNPTTLQQAISICNRLRKDSVSDSTRIRALATFGLGCLLGILHGRASHSLSIPSAHAFSMAPGYVQRYAREHSLIAPLRDVKHCILKKARILLGTRLPAAVQSKVQRGCASELTKAFPWLRGKVDLIITSPPYLNAQTYAKDNWLRLWFLGHNHRDLQPQYLETGSVQRYSTLMSGILGQCCQMLSPGGHLIIIAGDVRRRTQNAKAPLQLFETANVLADLISSEIADLSIVDEGLHVVDSKSRYYHLLSKSNGHAQRPLTERFFVAKKR